MNIYSNLARRYGHPLEGRDPATRRINHELVLNPLKPLLKSGLTPLLPDPQWDDQSIQYYLMYTKYQQNRLHRYTSAELGNYNAWAPSDSRYTNFLWLQNVPLHPILQRPRWCQSVMKHQIRFPLGNNQPGYWEAQNDLVWNALLPALHLASYRLLHPTALLWHRSLYFGDFEDIPEDEVDWKDGDPEFAERFRVWRRGVSKLQPDDIDAAVQKKLLDLSKKTIFNLYDPYVDAENATLQTTSDGLTYAMRRTIPTQVLIYTENIEPLLNPLTTIAERFVATHVMAETIVHELCHAIWYQLWDGGSHSINTEAWFEDERTCELGWSMMQATIGGLAHPMNSENVPQKGTPHCAVFERRWNCIKSKDLSALGKTLIQKPPDWETWLEFPLDIETFARENRPEWWNLWLNKVGSEGLHSVKAYIGHSFVKSNYQGVITASDNPMNNTQLVINLYNMSADEVARAQFENARIDVATQVHANVVAYTNASTNVRVPQNITRYRNLTPDERKFDPNPKLPIPFFPRLQEIKNYILANASRLNFNTWRPEFVSEHLVHQGIMRLGGINISHEEWRAFLICCDANNELFNFTYIGGPPQPLKGFVKPNENGWPYPWPPHDQYPPPTADEVYRFIEGCRFMNTGDDFIDFMLNEEWFDCDKGVFLDELNHALDDNSLEELSADELDSCIEASTEFTFGFPGTIRKHPEKWDEQPYRPILP